MTRFITAASLVLSLFMSLGVSSAAEAWRAGVAKVNITPEKLMWMAGYGARNHPAEGKMTDLWAKALALEDATGKRAVLITLDLVGIDRGLSQRICERLHKQHGLTREQIAINCSHTHSGPVVAHNLRPLHIYALDATQQGLIRDYADRLETSVAQVVAEAIKSLAPATVEWGVGQTDFAVNRRTNKEAEVPMLREAGQLLGPSDYDVPVLAVRDNAGKLRAITVGYACHATVLSGYDWSADYPGFAQIELEKAHPGCIALFWAGCGGDQNPLPRRTQALAEKYGRQLAAAAEEVLARPLTPSTGPLATSYAEVPLALDKLPTRDELVAQLTDSNKYLVLRARMLLEQLDAGHPLAAEYPYPVQRWQLGPEVQWYFLGGEVVVDYALRIKAELNGPKTWVAGYSNDVMAYIPSRRVLLEGGYEGATAMIYYGLPTTWSDQVETTILAEVHRQARK
ncbi:MAG: neutral/alkaline non-lysosomal ceramidase N-terminal domain-containing protein [Pirellulaceae bacterium]|nr:neutral/alkaline non-lysosomal ceramidase N-terminal domain-containing protein [Pirellulaceae bacterium]